jgi:hypothetical protein
MTVKFTAYSSEQIVAGLYRAILGREADEAGLATYAAALDSGCGVEHVASHLMHSPEFRNRLPFLTNVLS